MSDNEENIKLEVDEKKIFKKPEKKKRVLTEAQQEALARGRAKAKATREAKKKLQEEQEKVNIDKSNGKKIKKKNIIRQQAVEKRVHRNANERQFEDLKFKIAEQFDNENDLKEFNRMCNRMSYDDFKDRDVMKSKLKSILVDELKKNKK